MSALCLKCNYSITEPICASCVINEIKVWLSEQPIKSSAVRKIDNKFNYLLNKIESMDYALVPSRNMRKMSVMNCIRCKQEMALMCFYCVNNEANKIMEDNLDCENSIESFQESFHTGFQNYELSKENNLLFIA